MMRLSTLYDNAMLYKDVTQWMRNKTFSTLFFGLLAVSLLVSALIISLPIEQQGVAGPTTFAILVSVLLGYTMIIAFTGYGLTTREFMNRTFELYELSGMSLEKMTLGKLLSMFTQFFFGFFCIVPFLFFAFILGGLDFYVVFAAAIATALITPPIYLLALLVSLASRVKAVATLAKIAGLLIIIIVVPWIALYFIITIAQGGRSELDDFVEFLKLLLSFDADAILGTVVFFAFYFQICLMMFYFCCNAISPGVDSRELHIKLLTLILGLSWFTFFCYMTSQFGFDEGVGYFAMVPLYFVMCLVGLVFYYNRLHEPIMARNRHVRAKWTLTRIVHFWLAASAWGGFRTILLLMCLSVVGAFGLMFAATISPRGISPGDAEDIFHATSLVIQVPFFLAFPAGFLLNFGAMRKRFVNLRMGVLMWWVVVGVGLFTNLMVFSHNSRFEHTVLVKALEFLSLCLSPISSVMIPTASKLSFEALTPWLRIFMGGIGIFLMYSSLRRRETLEGYEAQGAFSPNGESASARIAMLVDRATDVSGEEVGVPVNEPTMSTSGHHHRLRSHRRAKSGQGRLGSSTNGPRGLVRRSLGGGGRLGRART